MQDCFVYASDPAWHIYGLLPDPYTLQDAEEYVARQILRPWESSPCFNVTLNGTGIGAVSLGINERTRVAEMGYGIARAHWGKGLTPEAARAVIDWAFPTYGLAKIYARADARNTQSHRVMEKVGLTREGVIRNFRFHRGQYVDDVWYGVLREQWETGRAQ